MQKSKLLALLLAVAMVASMVVVPAHADPVVPTYCEKCGDVPAEEWIEWTGGQISASGHYYVTQTLTLAERISIGNDKCIDLCGNTVIGPSSTTSAANSGEVFRIYSGATLTLMSSAAGGKVQAVGTYTAAAQGGNIYVGNNCKLYAYDVEITGGKVNYGNDQGGNIYAGTGTTVYLKNCNVNNGTAGDVNTKDDNGGNIYSAGTSLTLVDCLISGGTAGRAGNVDIKGASATSKATLTISGTTQITGGTVSSADGSGSFCVRANGFVDVNISSGVQLDGLTLAATTFLNMTGGNVGAINVRHGDKSLHNIYGGTIGVLEGNNHKYLTIHNAVINAVNTANIGTGDAYGEATIDTDATVLNFDETGMLVVHEAGNCATCNQTYTGNVDLKGKTMTVAEGQTLDTSIGGNITDSLGGGKLVGSVLFNEENTMLPIETAEDTYVLENVVFKSRMRDYTEGNATAKFDFYLDNAAAATAMDEALKAGKITIQVKVTWNGGEKTFALDSSMDALDVYADNWDAKMLVLNLTGLEGITGLQCTAQVVANGVTAE